MKLIASIDFANPKWGIALKNDKGECAHLPKVDANGEQVTEEKTVDGKIIQVPGFHTNHIHKGAIFEIGQGETFGEMTEQKEALGKIQQLAHCAIPMIAANAGLVKKVQKEVADDAKRIKLDAERAKAAASATMTATEILKQLPGLIGAAVKAALAK